MNDEGWFPAVDSRIRDEDGRPIGEPNVVGRFDDCNVIDGAASKAAGGRKNVYRLGIKLHSRILVSPMGSSSSDMAGQVIKFVAYPDEAAAALKRFPEAWRDYQSRRKAPLQPGESDTLDAIGFVEMASTQSRGRRRRPKADANVIPLKSDVA